MAYSESAATSPRQQNILDAYLNRIVQACGSVRSAEDRIRTLYSQVTGGPDHPSPSTNVAKLSSTPGNIGTAINELEERLNNLHDALSCFQG